MWCDLREKATWQRDANECGAGVTQRTESEWVTQTVSDSTCITLASWLMENLVCESQCCFQILRSRFLESHKHNVKIKHLHEWSKITVSMKSALTPFTFLMPYDWHKILAPGLVVHDSLVHVNANKFMFVFVMFHQNIRAFLLSELSFLFWWHHKCSTLALQLADSIWVCHAHFPVNSQQI